MRDVEVERVMLDFLERRTDVLISTLIIESGLDIPSVNTMLVNRADTLGLAQTYQLRGRIARSHHHAFCYLLVPAGKVLTEEADQRLRAISEHEELGAGLQIAMRDLEIRGAGNLLGPEQHGFMASVGFDLYCRMVDEVVQELQGTAVARRPEPELASDLAAFVPEEYIVDRDEKLDVYRRMAGLSDLDALEALDPSFAIASDRSVGSREPARAEAASAVGPRCGRGSAPGGSGPPPRWSWQRTWPGTRLSGWSA
jgi:transcription-repair coupling factor (superfamily II helicase)